ncbi:MAG: arylamine N-acetyltransferase [Clostridiales bacterium]|nr:arylamine N-acetyltransferase [Clostridiales bacterium]
MLPKKQDADTQSEIRAYFNRLGLPPPEDEPSCTCALLEQLQLAHVTRIPYENLDILAGRPLPMTWQGQFQKMVANRRGGYCFELNGLFANLLSALGYEVTTYMGRFLRGETTIPMRRHRVIRAVCAEGTFICDVGVGQSAPRYPLELVPGRIQEQFGETYKITREPFFGYVIHDLHRGQWRRFYSFTEEEQLDIDFVMPSFYCEKSPDSIFNKALMLSIKTLDGRKTIDGQLFRTFSGDEVTENRIASAAELNALLQEHFNLDPPDLDQAGDFLARSQARA